MAKTQNKEKYVDGYVLVVPKKKVEQYRKMAQEGGRVWKKCGAIDYKECMSEDLNPEMGGMPMLSFAKLMNLKKDETVWFSYITYKSRKHRDEVNKKVNLEMEKKAKKYKGMEMPFDMKRMAFGGFEVVVSG